MSEATQPAIQCASCTHWLPREDRQFGKCRRYPPAVLSRVESTFPDTRAENWCGEWQQSAAVAQPLTKKNLSGRVEPTGPVTGADAPAPATAPAPTPIVDIAPPTGTPPQPPKPRRGPKTT